MNVDDVLGKQKFPWEIPCNMQNFGHIKLPYGQF